MRRKCILFANTARYLHHYRGGLIRRLTGIGWQVVLVSPHEHLPFVGDFERWNAIWRPVRLKPGSTNPISEFGSLSRLVKIYRDERPDLAHHFTPKGVIYGSVAARFSRTPAVVNSVTGLGHVFTDPGTGASILRTAVKLAYRFVLGGAGHRIVVQNESDWKELQDIGASNSKRTTLIRGSGVDITRFSPKRGSRDDTGRFRVLYAARLLREKGLMELVAAVGAIAAAGHDITLVCAGEPYPDNPSSLTANEMNELRALPFFDYVGYQEDMPALIDSVDIVALPTYREGASRLLMEAGAMEKPVISTEIPGNEKLVIDGQNGVLVPVKRVEPLRDAILMLMNDAETCRRFGKAGRQIVSREFSESVVIQRTLAVYDEAMEEARSAGRLLS